MKYYLLIGFGVTNKNLYEFLKKRRKKIKIYEDDLKNVPRKLKHLILRKEDLNSFFFIFGIISPGIKPNHWIIEELKNRGVEIITDLDLLYIYNKKKQKKAYYVGITGTNGKTTTLQMINTLISNSISCGNIGASPFPQKVKRFKNKTIYLIELSSYQLYYTKYIKFNRGMIINIQPNHDEWHGSFELYKLAKESLIKKSLKFLEGEREETLKKNSWRLEGLDLYFNEDYLLKLNSKIFLLSHNNINLINSLNLVLSIFNDFNLSYFNIPLENIKNFQTDKYRQEVIFEKDHLIIINDSKSTSGASVKVALENWSKSLPVILILGGNLKGDFLFLINFYEKIDFIYFYSPSNSKILEKIKKELGSKLIFFINLKEAICFLFNKMEGKVILFSPGSGAQSEFKDYKHRGAFFTNEVKKIIDMF